MTPLRNAILACYALIEVGCVYDLAVNGAWVPCLVSLLGFSVVLLSWCLVVLGQARAKEDVRQLREMRESLSRLCDGHDLN